METANGYFSTLIVLLSLSLFVAIFAVMRLTLSHLLFRPRLKMLMTYRPTGKIGDISSFGSYRNQKVNRRFLIARKKKNSLLKKILNFILEHFLIEEDKLKLNFQQAGWSSHSAVSIFLLGKVALVFISLILFVILISVAPVFKNMSFLLLGIFSLIFPLVGWVVPDIYLNMAMKKRFKKIENNFPQVLDLIVICVGAGLPFNRSIERVAREFAVFDKDVARELALTSIELELILDTKQALSNLASRVPIPMIKTFTTTLFQSFQQGTPLLEAMDKLSEEIRDDASQSSETHAAKMPSLLMLPLVLLILPSLFIILLGPAFTHLVKVI